MDKTWMSKSRVSSEYQQGVKGFLDFAFANISSDQIVCPCRRCVNSVLLTRDEIYEHLIINGIMRSYKIWYDHGESSSSSMPNVEYRDEFSSHVHVQEMLQDAFGVHSNNMEDETTSTDPPPEGPNDEANQFFKLLEDANKELYPGCTRFTKLALVVRLYHIKCLSGWSNKSLDLLLSLLKDAFPEGETLPNSFYEMKKIIKDLGLDYKKIDACPNDCMLYWKETAHDEICKVCGVSRWKQMQKNLGANASSSVAKEKKIPEKVLRHFPLIPRLQRLFMSSKTAPLMIWHDRDRVKDGFLRHPADSTTWTDFDTKHKSFSSDHRNVRLGLAADGFNPFRTMSVSYSTWPVILTVYNLPPWMCMKQPYLILSLLIPGPHEPGNDIDVYLQPLIDELKELWEFGVNTYDAHTNQTFQMKASLLWTISDFPGYAMLSGWSTKGRLACPYCNKDTWSKYLKHSRKFCYMGHRQFLDPAHEFRSDKKSFDGTEEFNVMPNNLSPTQMLEQLEGFHNDFGKRKFSVTAKRIRRLAQTESKDYYNWKKKSIFFELPYWKYNLVRHNLDVMHIEKNVCDNILGTLLNAVGKSKDTLKARLDLCEMQIRSNLHPIGVGNKTYVPPACYTMNTKERDKLCSVLKNVKVPDGYSSNISRCVNLKDHKIAGLKSHDCHVLMQQLLPIAIRGTLTKSIVATLVGLCSFFRELCLKKACAGNFDKLQSSIVRILCNLERIFPRHSLM